MEKLTVLEKRAEFYMTIFRRRIAVCGVFPLIAAVAAAVSVTTIVIVSTTAEFAIDAISQTMKERCPRDESLYKQSQR